MASSEKIPLAGANLCAEGQNVRLKYAIFGLALGLGLAVLLSRAQVSSAWRLLTFIPFFFASFGALQALYRVCPAHSAQGTRETSSGLALPQTDKKVVEISKYMACKLTIISVIFAVTATLVVIVLP